jgi:hypothetical protein
MRLHEAPDAVRVEPYLPDGSCEIHVAQQVNSRVRGWLIAGSPSWQSGIMIFEQNPLRSALKIIVLTVLEDPDERGVGSPGEPGASRPGLCPVVETWSIRHDQD